MLQQLRCRDSAVEFPVQQRPASGLLRLLRLRSSRQNRWRLL